MTRAEAPATAKSGLSSHSYENVPAMRVVIAAHYWPPHLGGTERIASEQATRLAKRRHDVTVVTSRLPGDNAHETLGGVRVVRIPTWNGLERFEIPFPLFGPSLRRGLDPCARDVSRHEMLKQVSVIARDLDYL